MIGGLVALTAVCSLFAAAWTHPAARAATGSCPVTVRGTSRKPPVEFVRTGLPVPYVHTWTEHGGIWIRLPRNGTIPAQRDADGTISAKFPWWRAVGGQLHASARPLRSAAPRLKAQVASAASYGPKGFVPSFLRFSGAGCWRITGSLRGRHSLSFVARVVVAAP